MTAPRLLVLADDLIWATRLEGQGRTLGATVQRFTATEPLIAALAAHTATPSDLVAIDATARAYDAEAAVRAVAEEEVANRSKEEYDPEIDTIFDKLQSVGYTYS